MTLNTILDYDTATSSIANSTVIYTTLLNCQFTLLNHKWNEIICHFLLHITCKKVKTSNTDIYRKV